MIVFAVFVVKPQQQTNAEQAVAVAKAQLVGVTDETVMDVTADEAREELKQAESRLVKTQRFAKHATPAAAGIIIVVMWTFFFLFVFVASKLKVPQPK